jgi:hypothetical protein
MVDSKLSDFQNNDPGIACPCQFNQEGKPP